MIDRVVSVTGGRGRYILNDEHEAIPIPDLMEWAEWFESPEHRRVAETRRGPVWISTVFLGLDHSFYEGPPILFETVIFGGIMDQYQVRCSTYAEAEAQHKAVCKRALGFRRWILGRRIQKKMRGLAEIVWYALSAMLRGLSRGIKEIIK